MPDSGAIRQNVILELETLGVSNAAGVFDQMVKAEKAAGKNLDKLTGSLKKYTTGLHEAGKAMKGLVFPASFGAALKTVDAYNKTILSLSASTNRLGIGLSSLEKNLSRLSRETSLTRVEVNKLFDEFQAGMRVISVGDFESVMKRIRSIVGTNVDAMSKMQGALAGISEQFPMLSRSLTEIAKLSKDASASDRAALKSRIRNLYIIGQMNDATYKQISAYLSGNQQMSAADKKRQKELQAQTEAMNEFRRHIEQIHMAVGTFLMPLMTKVSDVLKSWSTGTRSWAKDLTVAGGVIAGLMAAKGLLVAGGRGLIGGVLGGGKVGGKKGGIGGSILGAMGGGTRVYVTNWPLSLGGKDLPGMARGKGGLWGKMKGDVGKAGGYGAFAKKALPGALKKLGIGAALYGGGMAADWYGGTLEKKGHEKTGAGFKAGGGLAKVGGAALTGAAIGSFVPVIGTAVGAIAGSLYGLATEWGGIRKNLRTMFGTTDRFAPKQGPRRMTPEEATSYRLMQEEKKGITSESQKQLLVSGHTSNLTKLAGGGSIVAIYEDLAKQTKVQNKLLEERRAMSIKGGEGVASYAAREKSIKALKGQLVGQQGQYAMDAGFMSPDEKKAAEADIADFKKFIAAKEQELAVDMEVDETLQDIYRKQALITGQQELLTGLARSHQNVLQAITGLYEAQAGSFTSLVEEMSETGNIDMGALTDGLEKSLSLLEAEKTSAESFLKTLQANKDLTWAQVKDKENLAKAEEKYFKGMQLTGEESVSALLDSTKMLEIEKQINTILPRRAEMINASAKAMDKLVKSAELATTKQGLMVQLADNFAIGVGASAEMRVRQYEAEGKVIDRLKKEFQIQRAMSETASGEKLLSVRNRMAEIENEILQHQLAQAQNIKVMRDGWVSAISAMNTGFGGFTEIIMDGNKGLAQMQRLTGAVRSNVTGAMARRGTGGAPVENVGWGGSQRFTARGGIGGRVEGRSKFASAWGGNATMPYNTVGLETEARGAVQAMMGMGANVVGGGGVPTALGAGNAMARGVVTEGGVTTDRRKRKGGTVGGGIGSPASPSLVAQSGGTATTSGSLQLIFNINAKGDLTKIKKDVLSEVDKQVETAINMAFNGYSEFGMEMPRGPK
jgi:hypothetical protein